MLDLGLVEVDLEIDAWAVRVVTVGGLTGHDEAMRWAVLILTVVGCGSEHELGGPSSSPGGPIPPAQTTDAQPRVEVHVQQDHFGVDILWVVDNSTSMQDDQERIADHFDAFVRDLSGTGIDYQVGVVSTDMEAPGHRGRLREVNGRRWIDRHTPAPETVFADMVRLEPGSYVEAGFEAAWTAVSAPGEVAAWNEGFVRPHASLEVVVVSDEDDSSNMSVSEFTSWFDTIKDGPTARFSAVVTPPEGCGSTARPGLAYLSAADTLGGLDASLCAGDWPAIVEDFAGLASTLRREYLLAEMPLEGSLQVSVERAEDVLTLGRDDFTWAPGRNTVRLESYVPSVGETIVFRYDVQVP